MLGIRPTDPVATLLTGPVAKIDPIATLVEAARALTRDHLGLLAVIDHTGLRGVLSERDLVAAIAEGLDLALERVVDHATDEVLWVAEATSIAAAAEAMLQAEVRHLVVLRDAEVAGVISLRDVVAALLEDTAVAG